jgi:hypothetical protein
MGRVAMDERESAADLPVLQHAEPPGLRSGILGWHVPTRTLYDAAASSPFSAGATRVPIASMARISFACGNDAAFI